MSGGWTGKTLEVNLTTRTCRVEPTDHAGALVGGRGWAARRLFDEVAPGTDPLGPENLLIFSTGPLTGTLFPAAGRLCVTTKSAVTGGYGSANGGGHFAPELKYAGFDHVVVRGAADTPVYLALVGDRVELRDARALWGLTTWETEDTIRREFGDPAVRVASIGPAGERAARLACIIIDKGRSASWSGCGGIMGAKNLKAIAARGSGHAAVARFDDFMDEARHAWQWVRRTKAMQQMGRYGTHGISGMDGLLTGKPQGVKNLSEGQWDGDKTIRLKQVVFDERFGLNRVACFGCPTPCAQACRVTSGPLDGSRCLAVHANTVRAFGPNLDIDCAETIIRATQLVGEFGMDLDATTAAIAWAYEAWERGLLTASDTEGLTLGWGQAAALPELLRQMAYREGFGALLSDGVAEAARRLGRSSDSFAMSIKGMGLNDKGLREYVGWALGIATSPRGAGHLNGAPLCEDRRFPRELSEKRYGIPTAFEPASYDDKEALVLLFERLKAVIDSLGLCYFQSYWYDEEIYGLEEHARALSAATGVDADARALERIGERIHNIEKAFNTLHAGFGRSADVPPERFFSEPVKTGKFAGAVLDRWRWNDLLTRYYAAHGWDPASGWQTRGGLEGLGLGDVAETLARHGRLIQD